MSCSEKEGREENLKLIALTLCLLKRMIKKRKKDREPVAGARVEFSRSIVCREIFPKNWPTCPTLSGCFDEPGALDFFLFAIYRDENFLS